MATLPWLALAREQAGVCGKRRPSKAACGRHLPRLLDLHRPPRHHKEGTKHHKEVIKHQPPSHKVGTKHQEEGTKHQEVGTKHHLPKHHKEDTKHQEVGTKHHLPKHHKEGTKHQEGMVPHPWVNKEHHLPIQASLARHPTLDNNLSTLVNLQRIQANPNSTLGIPNKLLRPLLGGSNGCAAWPTFPFEILQSRNLLFIYPILAISMSLQIWFRDWVPTAKLFISLFSTKCFVRETWPVVCKTCCLNPTLKTFLCDHKEFGKTSINPNWMFRLVGICLPTFCTRVGKTCQPKTKETGSDNFTSKNSAQKGEGRGKKKRKRKTRGRPDKRFCLQVAWSSDVSVTFVFYSFYSFVK